MKSRIYFTEKLDRLKELVEKFSKNFEKGEVAVKLHMGERNNPNYLRPEIAKAVCDKLKELGFKPFLFDTNTAYPGDRNKTSTHIKSAKDNGFDFSEIKIGEDGEYIFTKGVLNKVEIAKELINVPNMIVLSHIKGHCDAGFGGAIKNLGMGAATVKEKIRCHDEAKPVFSEDKCTNCRNCERLCHASIIKINGKLNLDLDNCHGCGVCVRNCPTGALSNKSEYLTNLLAEVASGALSTFNNDNVFYINVLEKITKLCDCCAESKIICPDIGILVSEDIVSIEKASIDLVNKKAGKNLFKEVNHIDPMEQINAAKKFKLGTEDYEII